MSRSMTGERPRLGVGVADLGAFDLGSVDALVVAGAEHAWRSALGASAGRAEDYAVAVVARLGLSCADLVCVRSPTGRPEFRHRRHDDAAGPGWSASHSGPLVAIAVSAHRGIGLDVQRKEPTRWHRVARRWFHPDENDWLMSLPEDDREDGFFRLWVIREACVKATGEGLRGFTTPVPVRPGTTGAWHGRAWHSFHLTEGYAAAVAVTPSQAVGPRVDVAVCWL